MAVQEETSVITEDNEIDGVETKNETEHIPDNKTNTQENSKADDENHNKNEQNDSIEIRIRQDVTQIDKLTQNVCKDSIHNNTEDSSKPTSNCANDIKNSNPAAEISLNYGKKNAGALLSDSKTVIRFSPFWKQSLAALSTILLTFTAGLTSGYSAILLPQLKTDGGAIPYDDTTTSWIASMAALPMAPGCLISGWMMEKFGRRNSHYFICGVFLVGWLLIACANSLTFMLAGRFFTGICVGFLGPLGPVYIAETTEPKLRGFFLAGVSLAIALGIFAAHLIGTFVTWQWTATISCLFPIVSVVLLALIPESPTWLISKGRIEDGADAFYWLRGYSDEAKHELKTIIDNKKASDSESVSTWREKISNIRSPELMKPLLIMIVFFLTCQFAGVNAVAFYSIDIAEKAVGKGLDHYLTMLIIDGLRVVMSLVACVVCKKYGRRPLCIISGIWTAVSMIGLSMLLYFKPANMAWLPLICLLVYISAISVGLVPLPWIMCGEVFPTRVRGLGSGISSAVTFVALFVVVKTAPGMMINFGEVVTFLIYGSIALIGTFVLYFILPETRGKSLQEIEDRFTNSKTVDPNA